MDVISYSKSQKAKKRINTVNKNLGRTEEFKNGELDIKDRFNSTAARIEKINENLTPAVFNNKVTEITKNTMINSKAELKKHVPLRCAQQIAD